MTLSDEEFESLVDIFGQMPDKTIPASSYVSLTHQWGSIQVTDKMIANFQAMKAYLDPKDKWYQLLEKVIKFHDNAVLTIE